MAEKNKKCSWLDGVNVVEDMVAWTADSRKMKEKLCGQKVVSFFVPKEEGDKSNYQVVIINGYKLLVKKGATVELPEQVAKLLADSYSLTIEAVNKRKLSGKKKEELEELEE